MTAALRGRYPRTPEVRALNSANARPGVPCSEDCNCGKHRVQIGRPGKKCQPGCGCGKHRRTTQHNARIGMSVALTMEAKRGR